MAFKNVLHGCSCGTCVPLGRPCLWERCFPKCCAPCYQWDYVKILVDIELRYLTYTEWSTLYGGRKDNEPTSAASNFRRLPFDHCCVSLIPWEDPYCDEDGNIFELQPLVMYLKKYKKNPVTGKVRRANSQCDHS